MRRPLPSKGNRTGKGEFTTISECTYHADNRVIVAPKPLVNSRTFGPAVAGRKVTRSGDSSAAARCSRSTAVFANIWPYSRSVVASDIWRNRAAKIRMSSGRVQLCTAAPHLPSGARCSRCGGQNSWEFRVGRFTYRALNLPKSGGGVDRQGHAHEFGETACRHLVHHPRAVDFHRTRRNGELVRYDLVGASGDQKFQNLLLAFG
jgi:hypothetical protein